MKKLSGRTLFVLLVVLLLIVSADIFLAWCYFHSRGLLPKFSISPNSSKIQGRVKLYSSVSGYQLQVNDWEKLGKLLDSAGFWRGGIIKALGESTGSKMETLEIHLVPELNDWFWQQTAVNPESGRKEIVATLNTEMNNDKVKIIFSFWDKDLEDLDRGNDRLDFLFWLALYELSPYLRNQANSNNELIQKVVFLRNTYPNYQNLLSLKEK